MSSVKYISKNKILYTHCITIYSKTFVVREKMVIHEKNYALLMLLIDKPTDYSAALNNLRGKPKRFMIE